MSLKTKKAIAEGRGFNTGTLNDGMMKQLKTFLTSVDVGWYLLLDNSGAGTDPHFFISNKATNVANDNTQAFYKVGFLTSEAGFVRITSYFKWDGASTFSIQGPYQRIETYDTAEFEFQCRADTELEFICLTTKPGSTAYTAILSVLKMDDSYLSTGSTLLQTISNKVSTSSTSHTLTVPDASAFLVGGIYRVTDTKTANASFSVTVVSKDTGLNTILVSSSSNLNVTIDASAQIGVMPHKFAYYYQAEFTSPQSASAPYNIGYMGYQDASFVTTSVNGEFHRLKEEDVSTLLSTIPTMVRPMLIADKVMTSLGTDLPDILYLGHIPYVYKSITRTAFTQGFTVSAVNYVSMGGNILIEEGTYV